jgi:hypothetical protein
MQCFRAPLQPICILLMGEVEGKTKVRVIAQAECKHLLWMSQPMAGFWNFMKCG